MRKLHYQLIDSTIPYSDPNSSVFATGGYDTDWTGRIQDFAEHNGIQMQDVILTISTKTAWKKELAKWQRQVKPC